MMWSRHVVMVPFTEVTKLCVMRLVLMLQNSTRHCMQTEPYSPAQHNNMQTQQSTMTVECSAVQQVIKCTHAAVCVV